MVKSNLDATTNKHFVQFVSNGSDAIQTEGKKTILVLGKAENTDELAWIRIGLIGGGSKLTQLNLIEGLQVMLQSQAEFKIASTTIDF